MVAGGLLGGLLLFAMAVLAQPRASAWTEPPEVHQESAPAGSGDESAPADSESGDSESGDSGGESDGDSDGGSAPNVNGRTGFEAYAAEVAADAAAALEEMAEPEQPTVADAGAGSQPSDGGSRERPGGRGRGSAGVTPPDQLVKPDEVEVASEGEQLPGGDEPDPEVATPSLLAEVAVAPRPLVGTAPAAPPAAVAANPEVDVQAAQGSASLSDLIAHYLGLDEPAPAIGPPGSNPAEADPVIRVVGMAGTVPLELAGVPIRLLKGLDPPLESSPYLLDDPAMGIYKFSVPDEWSGSAFLHWEATFSSGMQQGLGDDPTSDGIFANDTALDQVTAYYGRLDVP